MLVLMGSGRRAAEQRYELAPPHSITSMVSIGAIFQAEPAGDHIAPRPPKFDPHIFAGPSSLSLRICNR
jgi:hypothetical protein